MTGNGRLIGPRGSAVRLDLAAIRGMSPGAQTVDHWIVTSPGWHPLWDQYLVHCVRLDDDVPGLPDPVWHFPGATHEIGVITTNPDYGPYGNDEVINKRIRILLPVNVAIQFEDVDERMRDLCELAVAGILYGQLNPEASGQETRVRALWETSLVRTLAHLRGEPHAT